jgi:hypothetical protein
MFKKPVYVFESRRQTDYEGKYRTGNIPRRDTVISFYGLNDNYNRVLRLKRIHTVSDPFTYDSVAMRKRDAFVAELRAKYPDRIVIILNAPPIVNPRWMLSTIEDYERPLYGRIVDASEHNQYDTAYLLYNSIVLTGKYQYQKFTPTNTCFFDRMVVDERHCGKNLFFEAELVDIVTTQPAELKRYQVVVKSRINLLPYVQTVEAHSKKEALDMVADNAVEKEYDFVYTWHDVLERLDTENVAEFFARERLVACGKDNLYLSIVEITEC